MHYSKNKDIAKIVRMHLRNGWRLHQGKKHGKLVAPNGRWVVVPSTPGDRRATCNFLGGVRRCHD